MVSSFFKLKNRFGLTSVICQKLSSSRYPRISMPKVAKRPVSLRKTEQVAGHALLRGVFGKCLLVIMTNVIAFMEGQIQIAQSPFFFTLLPDGRSGSTGGYCSMEPDEKIPVFTFYPPRRFSWIFEGLISAL